MDFVVIIPARMESTRLPGKPLLDIHGKPMVVRTALQAHKSNATRVIIATDSNDVLKIAHSFNIEAVLTSRNHTSGTDRIAEAARSLNLDVDRIVVNVQGDEPLIQPQIINKVANKLSNSPACVMSTCASIISRDEQLHNPNVVKVVCNYKDEALYFSRASIPFSRDGNHIQAMHHIGIYAFRNSFLQSFSQLPTGQLESIESLEQLRALENGFAIAVERLNHDILGGVDTQQDLERVRSYWSHGL